MVIFFDIDGTLIDESTQVLPESTARAIQALVDNGHIPVVNTGRPYTHIDRRVRQLPFAGGVCACGSQVLLQGRWLKRETIPEDVLRHIIQMVRACGLQVVYEAEGGFYLDGENSSLHPEIRFQKELMEKNGGFVRDIREGITAPVIKFVTFDMPGCKRAEMVAEMEQWFTCIDRRGMVEYVCKGSSKALGLEMILRELDCPREETMAFGDSPNDLTMFQAVKHAVCMGNGADKAKAAATYITDTVVNDGIEKALRAFGLI